MAVLTGPQTTTLGRPPKPPEPNVRLIDQNGKPTRELTDYLTKLYEWQRRLYTVLTT